jgi:hypothetical protein
VVFISVLSAYCNVLGRSGACIKLCFYLNTKRTSRALEKKTTYISIIKFFVYSTLHIDKAKCIHICFSHFKFKCFTRSAGAMEAAVEYRTW